MESTLSSPCSRQGAAPDHLDSPPLMIWYSGQTALFLLARAAAAYLRTALSVALRPLFPFQHAQYAQVFPLKPAPFCMLCWSRQHQQVCLFFYLTLALSSSPCPLLHLSSYLKLCGRSGRNCLLSPRVLSGYSGSLDTSVSRRTTWLMSWPDGEHYLRHLQSLVVSLLFSLVPTLVLFRTGGVLSHLNSLAPRFPQFLPRNLCSLVTHAVFSLVYAAMDTVFC